MSSLCKVSAKLTSRVMLPSSSSSSSPSSCSPLSSLFLSKIPNISTDFNSIRWTTSTEVPPGSIRFELLGKGPERPGYPRATPNRKLGADYNLQERLNMIYEGDVKRRANRTDIGRTVKRKSKSDRSSESRSMRMKMEKERRERKVALEILNTQKNPQSFTIEDIQREHSESGNDFDQIKMAADHYGIYDDIFGHDKWFTPTVLFNVEYNDPEWDLPVCKGNIIKPGEAAKRPTFSISRQKIDELNYSEDANEGKSKNLHTLVMVNLDGNFHNHENEVLHWMVSNIGEKESSEESMEEIVRYLPPHPPMGSGYHRYAFILFEHSSRLDLSRFKIGSEQESPSSFDLKERSKFSILKDFYDSNLTTPVGLSFFQSDWDSSLTKFYHNVLEIAEPRYEYHFIPPHIPSWSRLQPEGFQKEGFNTFLDKYRDPKVIQRELVNIEMQEIDPFDRRCGKAAHLKYPNLSPICDRTIPMWRRREMERIRLRQSHYADLHHVKLSQDPNVY